MLLCIWFVTLYFLYDLKANTENNYKCIRKNAVHDNNNVKEEGWRCIGTKCLLTIEI